MSETQSRYGMVQEMKNRKIKEKEKLANIEKDFDDLKYKEELRMEQLQQEINDRNKSYEFEHKQTVRELQVALKMLKSEYQKEIAKLEDTIKEENDTYQQRHEQWVAKKQATVNDIAENLARNEVIYKKKIDDKKAVINEIEDGIKSLKEISQSQMEG